MKRFLFLSSAIALTLISCKKEYTCSCVQTVTTSAYEQYGTYHPQATTANTFSNTIKAKQDEVESKCKKGENLNIQTYGTGEAQRTVTETVTCEVL
ncbi:hypothetical protein [Brumimicrobium salinarum]|nr:hypothetical protein [Brumimicrobium salinarum]